MAEGKWSVGDIAICIDNSSNSVIGLSPPLKKDGEYEVIGISKCPQCGILLLDVGLVPTSPFYACSHCNLTNHKHEGIWWVRANRFKKKNEPNMDGIEEMISRALQSKEHAQQDIKEPGL